MMFQIFFFKQKKSESDFKLGTPPAEPAKQKKTSSSCKFIEVTHLRKSGHGCGSGVIISLLKLVFSKIPDLVHRRTMAPVAQEIAARWRYRFLAPI